MKNLIVLLVVALLAISACAPKTGNLEENKALIHNYIDALSGKDKPAETVDQYVADEALKQHIAEFEAAFPRYQLVAEDMIAEGDKVVVRGTVMGTQTGEFVGIAPTGKQVTVPFMIIYRIANGKIVEHWLNADQLGLMQQLGYVPTPSIEESEE